MNIYRFEVRRGSVCQVQGPFVRVMNACSCGCSPKPFVSISDGGVGVTVEFDSDDELKAFKAEVQNLSHDCLEPIFRG